MIFLVWIGVSIAVGIGAGAKGRNGFGWFVLSLLISPLIAGFLVLVLPELGKRTKPLPSRGRRPCPFCAEPILNEAKLCPHCHSGIPAYIPLALPVAPAQTDKTGAIVAGVLAAIGVLIMINYFVTKPSDETSPITSASTKSQDRIEPIPAWPPATVRRAP